MYANKLRAALLLKERRVFDESRFVEIVIWRVPRLVHGSSHDFKYRLALIADGVCVARFDNVAGKGDHRHIGTRQSAYAFTTVERLMDDFWRAVDDWRPA